MNAKEEQESTFPFSYIIFSKYMEKLKAAISAVSLLQILSRLNLFKSVTYPRWPEIDPSSELSSLFSPELQLSLLDPSSELSSQPLLELGLAVALSSPTRQTRKDIIGGRDSSASRQFWRQVSIFLPELTSEQKLLICCLFWRRIVQHVQVLLFHKLQDISCLTHG